MRRLSSSMICVVPPEASALLGGAVLVLLLCRRWFLSSVQRLVEVRVDSDFGCWPEGGSGLCPTSTIRQYERSRLELVTATRPNRYTGDGRH